MVESTRRPAARSRRPAPEVPAPEVPAADAPVAEAVAPAPKAKRETATASSASGRAGTRSAGTRSAGKAPATTAAPTAGSTAAGDPVLLAVREDEQPWTAEELSQVRADLTAEVASLRGEVAAAESGLAELVRESNDGAGDDQADAGTKTFEREQEMSLANNARGMLAQAERALERIEDGTYGICESCGRPIGKARLKVFPRATLCVPCKQREERR